MWPGIAVVARSGPFMQSDSDFDRFLDGSTLEFWRKIPDCWQHNVC
jgi:hypothetical protein